MTSQASNSSMKSFGGATARMRSPTPKYLPSSSAGIKGGAPGQAARLDNEGSFSAGSEHEVLELSLAALRRDGIPNSHGLLGRVLN